MSFLKERKQDHHPPPLQTTAPWSSYTCTPLPQLLLSELQLRLERSCAIERLVA